jgi:hypothetical protein
MPPTLMNVDHEEIIWEMAVAEEEFRTAFRDKPNKVE